MILKNWDSARVALFAPDARAVKASRKLATPGKWLELGRDEYTAWGRYRGSSSSPYEVKLDLLRLQKAETAHHCTCPSRKQPCKHAVGLLFMLVEQDDAVKPAEPPAYVVDWLDRLAQRARREQAKKARSSAPPDPAQQALRAERRQAAIAAGMEELQRWLFDLVRQGLAEPQLQQSAFWEKKAARMVDAQAPGIGSWLRQLATVAAMDPPRLLPELGRLYLLVCAVLNFDALSAAEQADLRTVLGWHLKREDAEATLPLRDRWLVLGRREEPVDKRLRQQRLWLRGEESGRFALILEFAFGDAPFDTHLQPGEQLDTDLHFYPSAYPLRAIVGKRWGEAAAAGRPQLGHSIAGGLAAYGEALAQNPWLLQFPFLLDDVWPMRYSGGWVVREAAGSYLPVSRQFAHKWSLLALGGDSPIQLAGEWDGETLLPAGALVEGRFVDLSRIGVV